MGETAGWLFDDSATVTDLLGGAVQSLQLSSPAHALTRYS